VPSRKKRPYAILIPVRDTGDLFHEGRFWRVVTTVKAKSVDEAVADYERRPDAWFQFLATDYAPALDVALSREVACFS
jgi:hypothetical protein